MRAEERKEDMRQISLMIEKGIKTEVQAVIKPLEDKIDAQERVNKDLYKKLQELQDQVNKLKEGVPYPQLVDPVLKHVVEDSHNPNKVVMVNMGQQEKNSLIKRQNLCSKSRKVIGFSPIEPRMLDIQMNSYGAKDIQEAMLLEVKSYLKCELKILPSIIDSLDFLRVFPPAKQHWNVLYVEFGNDEQIETIFSHTKNIQKKDYRVLRWVPKQMYSRYRALESLAYELRQEKGLKTRVKIGKDDFILSTRDPKLSPVSPWIHQILPNNLPEIALDKKEAAEIDIASEDSN